MGGTDLGVGGPGQPGGVEFDGGDDEVLDLGPRRTLRPSVVAALAAVVLAGAVTAVVVHGRGGEHRRPVAATSASPSAGPSARPTPVQPSFSATGDPVLDLSPPLAGRVLAVALGPTRRYVLTDQELVADDLGSGAELATSDVTLPSSASGPPGASGGSAGSGAAGYRMVVDPVGSRLWIVPEGGPVPATVLELDALDLQVLSTVSVPAPIHGSVILDGRLYLATSGGVRAADPADHAARPVAGLGGDATSIAADPTRDRLVVAIGAGPTRLVALRPGRPTPSVTVSLPDPVSLVAVVSGSIWVGQPGGGDTGGPSIRRLDPTTLAVVTVASLGPTPELLAAGTGVLWVRSGAVGNDLWCVDGGTGVITQSWAEPTGTVVSQVLPAPPADQVGVAYLATPTQVRALVLVGCAG